MGNSHRFVAVPIFRSRRRPLRATVAPGSRGSRNHAMRRVRQGGRMKERFERHRQPWRGVELHKVRTLAGKGVALKAIAKALVRSEESIKQRAKEDGLKIAKLR